MPIVMTIDQRSSRGAEDLTRDWTRKFNARFNSRYILPFAPTVGDEIQAVTSDPEIVIEIALEGVRHDAWWLGLGVGEVDMPLGDLPAHSRGQAFYRAREAVEQAKKEPYGLAVSAEDPELARDVQTVLELLGFITRKRGRTAKRWRAIELAGAGASTVQIGRELGISQQAASKRLRNAGFEEEVAGRYLAERLLVQALETVAWTKS